MTCQQTRESLGDRSVGLLDAHAMAAFDEHVAACGPCQAAVRQFDGMLSLLDHTPRPMPARDLWPGVRARLDLERSVASYARTTPGAPPRSAWWSSAIAAAAGFASAAVILASLTAQGAHPGAAGQAMAAVPPVAVSVSRHNAMEASSPVADGASIVAVDALTVRTMAAPADVPAGALR